MSGRLAVPGILRRTVAAVPVVALALLPGGGCRLESETRLHPADVGALDGSGTDSADGTVARCAVVTTTEFRADGAVTVVDVDTLEVARDVTAVHSDAVVRVAGGRVFVVNREGGDSVQELDPRAGFATVSQRSVGPGTNPWGVALMPDGTAWVPLYNAGALQRIDTWAARDSDFLIGDPAPLPTWTDADERPEPRDVFLHDGVLYVLVQGLGAYPRCTADSRGWLHAFDPDTLEPVDAFAGESSLRLGACNPRDLAFVGDDVVAIAHAGGHRVHGATADDGGLELVDLAAGVSLGVVATESDFGDRDLIGLALDGTRAWLALADADFGAEVRLASLEPFTLGEAAWHTDEGGVFDIEIAYGRVWVADRSLGAAGLVVLDARTGELVAGPLDTGFPPFDIGFVEVRGACGSPR